MQISSRFTIAVHTLLCIARFSGSQKVTSAFIAGSVNVNPVVIRRTLGQLKEAGIVLVEAGVGGATLARPAERITLLDVYFLPQRKTAIYQRKHSCMTTTPTPLSPGPPVATCRTSRSTP